MGVPAIFLDKDGTLIDDVPYNVDPDRIVLARGAGEALRAWSRAGYRLVVVSNQSGVARGLFPISALGGVEARLRSLLAAEGVGLDAFCFCPHHPEGTVEAFAVACACRKPSPGLIRDAATRMGLDLKRSWMVGDILDDVEAGRRAGCRTVFLDNGNETVWRRSPEREPDLIARDLAEAATLTMESAHRGS